MDNNSYMNNTPMNQGVLVPKAYLDSIEKDSNLLQALLAEGVMEWSNYEAAKQTAEEE